MKEPKDLVIKLKTDGVPMDVVILLVAYNYCSVYPTIRRKLYVVVSRLAFFIILTEV
jgi:hypothetical protein